MANENKIEVEIRYKVQTVLTDGLPNLVDWFTDELQALEYMLSMRYSGYDSRIEKVYVRVNKLEIDLPA